MASLEKIKVAIVDDEPLALSEMKRMLAMFEDIHIAFEAESAEEAIKKYRKVKPGLIFLDIGLPEINGLQLAGLLAKEECKVVFCTADPSHALEAFDLNAIDYLHKPIDIHRLSQSLEKFRSQFSNPKTTLEVDHIDMEKPILINDGSKTQLFTPKQIELVLSIGNYVKIRGEDLNIVAQHTMSYMEVRLSDDIFFRANRSTLVNLSKVKKVDFSVNGNNVLVMNSGEEIPVSRRQSAQMKKVLKL